MLVPETWNVILETATCAEAVLLYFRKRIQRKSGTMRFCNIPLARGQAASLLIFAQHPGENLGRNRCGLSKPTDEPN